MRAASGQVLGGTVLVAIVAAVLTTVMAWPVLTNPATTVFGPALAGPHPDAFVVASQYEHGMVPRPYLQPATDLPGMAAAAVTSGLTAYNLLVLVSFPLTAAFTYALVIVLTRSTAAGIVAAAAFAFTPFHFAHAAYHVHIVQLQWWPLWLLASCVAVRQSWPRALLTLVVPGALLLTASFYWALAALFMVPAIFAGLWWRPDTLSPSASRHTAARLLIISVVGAVAAVAAASAFVELDTLGFGAADRAWYSARWFSVLLPSVMHPVFGGMSDRVWSMVNAGPGLLEQQLGPGIGVLVLAAVALFRRWRTPDDPLLAPVPFFVLLGLVAWGASMFGGDILGSTLPSFRAYARIGIVSVLALSILAGIGAAALLRMRARRPLTAALLLVTAVELAPPAGRWNPALPTAAHTWIATHVPGAAVLDCTAPGRVYGQTVRAQFPGLIRFREAPFEDCVAPDIGGTLAAHGVTHMILRRALREAAWLEAGGRLDGVSIAAREEGALVLRIDAPASSVYVTDVSGLSPREFDGPESWRWMEGESSWLVLNRGAAPVQATFEITGRSADGDRTLRLSVPDGGTAEVRVGPHGSYQLGPVTLPLGETRVRLRTVDPASGPSVRIDQWRWRVN